MCGFLKRAYLQWRSRCPFVRKLEAWRMKRKLTSSPP